MLDLLATNFAIALPSDLLMLISLYLIRNSSDKLRASFTHKKIYIAWVPYWIIHSIFYFSILGKILLYISTITFLVMILSKKNKKIPTLES